MPVLVADCRRCSSGSMTFDVHAAEFLHQNYEWQNVYEAFSVCRHCQRSTVFIIEMSTEGMQKRDGVSARITKEPAAVMRFDISLNPYFDVRGSVNVSHFAAVTAPEHLPDNIRNIFDEGARCLVVECYNAAATMFRLCLDLVSKPLLPDPGQDGIDQPTNQQRRNLGPRLGWLFEQGRLPADVRDLATAVKDDGNDGAHDGSLTKEDAEDLLDFTTALLERLFTEPKRIEHAKQRRALRRQPN